MYLHIRRANSIQGIKQHHFITLFIRSLLYLNLKLLYFIQHLRDLKNQSNFYSCYYPHSLMVRFLKQMNSLYSITFLLEIFFFIIQESIQRNFLRVFMWLLTTILCLQMIIYFYPLFSQFTAFTSTQLFFLPFDLSPTLTMM